MIVVKNESKNKKQVIMNKLIFLFFKKENLLDKKIKKL
jgi:hypothetical protein